MASDQEESMRDQFLGLPWDAWSAISGAGTFLVGSAIAIIAARASYLQFYGTLQIEFETIHSADDQIGFYVECRMHNRSPFSITVFDVEAFAREWALVSTQPGAEPRRGPMLIQKRMAPHEDAGFRFYITGFEGRPRSFRAEIRWGRQGLSGRLKTTKVEVSYRPRVSLPASKDST